ncbi:hypothetical protein AAFC00_007011 [Neodothiora populina]|uniref:G-protein coupled receptors family 2 profile 2 domain-containing protein n=1 Tax=Neodothiora populina TaxID=2781224 RepID=A0ABR3PD61_9PEZI
MEFNATRNGRCPIPFYDASMFPSEGGFIDGRLCATTRALPGNPTCCLPCPTTYWTYHDSFSTYNSIAAWLNVVGFILLFFLLTSYFFLPVQQTRRHYLSVCLIVGVLILNLGFIVPLGAQPDQCYNAITPNDMHSSMTCAWSGAFIVAGGLSGAIWILIRALSMHLQICWDIMPGQRFYYFSHALGWGGVAILVAATLSVTGVSFRFGGACHVNHEKSMTTFWGWLLGAAVVALILQLATFGHCLRVFIANLWSGDSASQSTHTSTSGGLPTYSASVRTQTARAIWRRLQSVLWLQWRGILIVTITLVDVIFFAVVFVDLDRLISKLKKDHDRAEPWILCLMAHSGAKSQCLKLAEQWLLKESVVRAVLIMLSLIGIQLFFLLFRWSLLEGWRDFFTKYFSKDKQEFISLDARRPTDLGTVPCQPSGKASPRTYRRSSGIEFEMQNTTTKDAYDMDLKTLSPTITETTTTPKPEISSPKPAAWSPPPRYPSARLPDPLLPSISQHQNQQQQEQQEQPVTASLHINRSTTRSPQPQHHRPYLALHTGNNNNNNNSTLPAPYHRTHSISSSYSNNSTSTYSATNGGNCGGGSGRRQSMGWDPTSTFASASFPYSHGLVPPPTLATTTAPRTAGGS